MTQDIGVRMKSYESNRRLESGAIIVRVDGKSFHTWTKQIKANRPFDEAVIDAMRNATQDTAESMQGFRLAYTQSDEASFLLVSDTVQEPWFGGKLDKIVSITASMFTYYFNSHWQYLVSTRGYPSIPAFFDARAFNIPIEDAANCFYWRQLDWMRNSIIMLGRAHFSHKQLHGKNTNEVKEMLRDKDIKWEDLYSYKKYGTYVTPYGNCSGKADYYLINELAGISAT
jgi:tRNA(His) guanylyltransferase